MTSASLSFLAPNSILVVGASNNPAKRGYNAIARLLADGFSGDIYPVNPKLTELRGLTCYANIRDVPFAADLALICTPAATVPDIIEQCGQAGVKGAVVLASGFSETGAAGEALEQACVSAARRFGLRLVGPNTSGLFNTAKKCNLVGFQDLRSGPVGVLSQSGNMALSMITESLRHPQLGFSSYIGVGNEAEIAFHEYLHYFAEDKDTRVIATYIEGLRQGDAFLQAARQVSAHKPIVLYKSGRTASGQSAARSHTGALAGDITLCRGVMRQAGVILVERSDHLLPVAESLAYQPSASGNRIAILADGGGHATIAADELSDRGMVLAELQKSTQQRLQALLGPQAPVSNPVDFAGASDHYPELFADGCELLLSDPGVDAVLVVGLFGGYQLRFNSTLATTEERTAMSLTALQDHYKKPVVLHSVYKHHRTKALRLLEENNIPVQDSVEVAAHCISALAQYGVVQQRGQQVVPDRHPIERNLSRARDILQQVTNNAERVVTEDRGRELLMQHGIQTGSARLVQSLDELDSAMQRLSNDPLAMKVVSPQIVHKSDAGGVRLNLRGLPALQQAFGDIMTNARNYQKDARLDGVLLSPMARPGVEIILGITRDPQFGPVMMFGLGGIHVEVLRDVSFRALPLNQDDAAEMLAEIRAKAILSGVRGSNAIDHKALIDLMLRLSRLLEYHTEIEELELNPVILYEKGLEILDVRILLGESATQPVPPALAKQATSAYTSTQ
ncbi:acetate--CoA ligase family protein [Aestuariirhabdus sp. Z084]|uniref:acetate--CoA ligase family protein n=1 Tax=Aestuariirhabdus haliotis TaxID=2918751 RepID=UPI00201B3AD1|nr:acetate--CoA ligase [Aestuariirhabdus haliotis]MCL6416796.1 acetate--CoA ligase family protein [Aestuariirhabdus haliotis]MCL6420796.1 acetate--CoA ligase family protein [Aestuariirhabdus haliotis]